MLRIKLEMNKKGEPIFKLEINKEDEVKYSFLRRALMEGKQIKGTYNYQIPIRFFQPIFNNISVENIILDNESLLSYLEFSDDFAENIYYTIEANPRYMKKWREEGCPNIYKIQIDKETLLLSKSVAFKRISPLN